MFACIGRRAGCTPGRMEVELRFGSLSVGRGYIWRYHPKPALKTTIDEYETALILWGKIGIV